MSSLSSSLGPMILNIPCRLQDSEHQILGVYRSWFERTFSGLPEHIPCGYLNIHSYFPVHSILLTYRHERTPENPLRGPIPNPGISDVGGYVTSQKSRKMGGIWRRC